MTTQHDQLVVLIVDDEKQAGLNLKAMLHEYVDPDIKIAGIAGSTYEAEMQIARFNPDAVFLDIEMPRENAFMFLSRISPVTFDIIFVTAYSNYAVKAFKLNAIDYILKPISVLELRNAVSKLRERRKIKKMISDVVPSYKEIADQVEGNVAHNKIKLRGTNGIEVIEFKNIQFIEAQSSYSKFVFLKDDAVREITMCHPLSDYEELLPPEMFFRVHRSFLVNCRYIKDFVTGENSHITINGNTRLPVSRRRIVPLIEFLKTVNLHMHE